MQALIDIFLKIFSWLLRRPKLKIRILEDNHTKEVGHLRFEVENQSDTDTSLNPIIKTSFWHPKEGTKLKYVKGSSSYDVRELDRKLPPFQAKIFSATARNHPSNYHFSWFRSTGFGMIYLW